MDGGAWPFLVGGVICLVNSDNERDSLLLTTGLIKRNTDVDTVIRFKVVAVPALRYRTMSSDPWCGYLSSLMLSFEGMAWGNL